MVEKMVATPALQLADVFPPFAWTFGKVGACRASAATPTATSAAEAHATPRRFSRFSCAQRTVSAHRASAPFSRLHDPLEDFSKKSFSSRRARRNARGQTLTSPPPSRHASLDPSPSLSSRDTQGDLMHWVPVLNHFDAFFEAHVAPRGEETLSSVSPLGAPFPAEPARWIVRASCVLLENCANKHVYGSCEHLGALLSCDDARVALDALRLLAVATRRAPGSRGNRRARRRRCGRGCSRCAATCRTAPRTPRARSGRRMKRTQRT